MSRASLLPPHALIPRTPQSASLPQIHRLPIAGEGETAVWNSLYDFYSSRRFSTYLIQLEVNGHEFFTALKN